MFLTLLTTRTLLLVQLISLFYLWLYDLFCYCLMASAGSVDDSWFDSVAIFESDGEDDDDFVSVQDGKKFADRWRLLSR